MSVVQGLAGRPINEMQSGAGRADNSLIGRPLILRRHVVTVATQPMLDVKASIGTSEQDVDHRNNLRPQFAWALILIKKPDYAPGCSAIA